jgi:hypothetical protein
MILPLPSFFFWFPLPCENHLPLLPHPLSLSSSQTTAAVPEFRVPVHFQDLELSMADDRFSVETVHDIPCLSKDKQKDLLDG